MWAWTPLLLRRTFWQYYSFHYLFKSHLTLHLIYVKRRKKSLNGQCHYGICYSHELDMIPKTRYIYKDSDGVITCLTCDREKVLSKFFPFRSTSRHGTSKNC